MYSFRPHSGSGKIALVEGSQFGPGSLRARLVVDLAAAHRPAVIATLVHFNGSLQMRCRKALFQFVFGGRVALVVVICNCAKYLRFHLGNQQVRAVRLVTD